MDPVDYGKAVETGHSAFRGVVREFHSFLEGVHKYFESLEEHELPPVFHDYVTTQAVVAPFGNKPSVSGEAAAALSARAFYRALNKLMDHPDSSIATGLLHEGRDLWKKHREYLMGVAKVVREQSPKYYRTFADDQECVDSVLGMQE